MSTDNAEHSAGAAETGLEGLPAAEKAETEAILHELEGEAPKPEETKADPDKPEGEKPKEGEEGKKPEDANDGKKPDGEGDKTTKPEARREVRMMPAWAHEAYKDKSEKEIASLKAEVERLASTDKPGGKKDGEGAPAPDELEKEASELAEKHGITAELAKDILAAARKGVALPPELMSKLSEVDDLKAVRDAEVETAKYNADFDRIILPLIKAEYGDDAPAEVISRVRDELKTLAYDPEGTYAKVPYEVIYRGQEAFRGLVPAPKKGAESSRGGSASGGTGAGEGKPDLSQPLADDVIRSLSDEDFETYSKNMEKRERDARPK